ncbi:sensor histidine kinase [Cyclobacterium marinum]|uniref:sensor histidine kinase n=1 Tax=Cyclobacterium marinum TaxID=104 RepID=UPI0030D711DF|tara:strand:- start:147251 stop:149269 length:2019 start_codon:yes stop_codon:yes gene_type:complete
MKKSVTNDSLNPELSESIIKSIEGLAIIISLFLSFTVLLGWYFEEKQILSIIPGSATMKFNTALVFLLAGILLVIQKTKKTAILFIYYSLALIIVIIGVFTLLEYTGWSVFSIDNLFVSDKFSSKYPGRMSPATAVCSVFLGLGFIAEISANNFFKKAAGFLNALIVFISILAITAYILFIPMGHKGILFQSMAIHTSLLFFLISILKILKNTKHELLPLIWGNFAGSKLIRKVLPLMILFPIIFNYLLVIAIEKELFSFDFGLIAYATIFIPLSIFYITYIALGLNKTDIEKQLVENDFRKSNRYLKQFKNGIDKAFILAITDKYGVITEVNETFCKISKYGENELIGKTHSILNSGHHDKQFFTKMWKTIRSGEIWIDEIKNKAKDGSYYWVLTAIVPFKNEDNQITEFMALRQDITDRKNAEEDRLQYLKKLEYKNKELEQFAFVASHDLQEPLRTVINFTDLLARKQKHHFDDIGIKSLDFIQEATVRMSQLIKSLLDYNRIDKNSKLSRIACNELIEEIKIDLDKKIADADATVIVNTLPTIIGYETPLRLLFQNLISNGIKFRSKEVKPYIEITARPMADGFLFMVKDNGIGISANHQEKIFEIFKRLHSKDEYDGSGIGLAHCRKIVDLHGGKIWVDSTPGSGSTFSFTIKTVYNEKKDQLHPID